MHASCLCSGFVFNALAFIFEISLSDMPITWSGSLLSAQRQCRMQCSDKNSLLLWSKLLGSQTHEHIFPTPRQTKDYCLFVLPKKKMSSNLADSSQYKFTLKTLFRFSLKHCLSSTLQRGVLVGKWQQPSSLLWLWKECWERSPEI